MYRLRERLLPRVDRIRGLRGVFGLTRFRVFVVVTTWDVERIGDRPGNRRQVSKVETEIIVGGFPPKVRNDRTSKDLIAGQSELKQLSFTVGPVTPEFYNMGGGGVSPDVEDPQLERGQTVLYRLTGPGLPSDGLMCKRESSEEDKPFRYMIHLRSTARKATR